LSKNKPYGNFNKNLPFLRASKSVFLVEIFWHNKISPQNGGLSGYNEWVCSSETVTVNEVSTSASKQTKGRGNMQKVH